MNTPFKYEPCGDSDGETIGTDHFVLDAKGDEIALAPDEAHGRLFAASPDLRDALAGMLADMEAEELATAAMDDARAALAKTFGLKEFTWAAFFNAGGRVN